MIFTNSPLIKFIQQESSVELKRLMYLSVLGGLSNMALVALINQAASVISKGELATWQFFVYLGALALYTIALVKSSQENITSTQALMHKFKLRIMSQVLKSDLITIDSIGRPWILQTLLRDTQVVSQSILVLVNTCQSAGTVIFLLLYLSFVSIPAFIVVNVCSVILVIIMYFNISNTADKF